MKQFWLVALITSSFAAEAPPAEATRIIQKIDGITCNYAAADETFVRLLAPLIAANNREALAPVAPAAIAATDAPVALLSIANFRRNRADCRARILAAIGLEKPTALQLECDDGYLDNFERADKAFALLVERMLTGADAAAANSVEEPRQIAPREETMATTPSGFARWLAPNSLTVIRLSERK